MDLSEQHHDMVYTHIFEPQHKKLLDMVNGTLNELGVVVELKTNSLRAFIPQIWAEQVTRNLQKAAAHWYASLPPEEQARVDRKTRNHRRYLKKVAWAKAHPKKQKRRR